jgi:hypothetical protein
MKNALTFAVQQSITGELIAYPKGRLFLSTFAIPHKSECRCSERFGNVCHL